MNAVVMAGGAGTRLRPLVAAPLNKHLVPVCGKPLILHVLEKLARGGVTQVLVLLNWKHPGLLLETIGDGSEFGLEVFFRYDTRSVGVDIGRHLELARTWVGDEPFVLMLGDALFFEPLTFTGKQAPHLWIMPLPNDDPSKYGQVKVRDGCVTELVDKPRTPFSTTIQTAVWVLPSDAFDRAQRIEQGVTGEFHIGALICDYVQTSYVTYTELSAGAYIDCGTPEALAWAEERARAMLHGTTKHTHG